METEPQPPDSTAMSSQQQQHHSRKRPHSRASTASIHSIATQPNQERNLPVAHNGSFQHQQQWHPMQHHPKDMPVVGQQMGSQMSADEMLLRPASQMSINQSFPMDSTMHPAGGSVVSYPHHGHQMQHVMPADPYGTSGNFTDADSQIMERDDPDESDRIEVPRPAGQKANRTAANNELEMRQLYSANRHRDLEEVAKELHGNERGPNSERTRQVFAMLWINQVCTKGKGSVPRGRVYANYASRCATERITVLNPASFGKLVRVLFPGLKTRRLGVRGESKYHYVNFSLMDDQPELKEPMIQPALPITGPSQLGQSFSTTQTQSQSTALDVIKPALPSPQVNQSSEALVVPTSLDTRSHSLYNQFDVASIDQLDSTTTKTMLHLAFPRDGDDQFDQSRPLILPRIEPFLPAGTDIDSAKSLAALYRSHCTSLVECIRYCREKTFFHLYTSFQGTLTMPVQKLFANPSLAPWIEQCDFILYQRMVQIIAGLTLQVVPKPVLDTLRNISERLVSHIRVSFQNQPRHVVQAKEAPATIFAALLDRALRVNLTAHAAANMLANSFNRDQMYLDWITMVRLRKVAECVPTKGMDDVVQVLLSEMRDLLQPENVPWEVESLTLYGDMAQRSSRDRQANAPNEDGTQTTMLDRWVIFLRSLPDRFPYATPADIVWCVQRVGTEVMRDLTIAQGKSFGSWWVTKCWIDEMVAFLAEQGGFMQSRSSTPAVDESKRSISVPIDTTSAGQLVRRRNSNSMDIDVPRVSNPQAQPDRAPFPSRIDNQDPLHSTNPDDSGIGIRTPEEDSPMDKLVYQQSPDQSLQEFDLDQTIA